MAISPSTVLLPISEQNDFVLFFPENDFSYKEDIIILLSNEWYQIKKITLHFYQFKSSQSSLHDIYSVCEKIKSSWITLKAIIDHKVISF